MKKIANDELGRPTPEEYSEMRKMPVTVLLDNVRSMNNVGAFFRTCDAFAVEKLILCGITGTPPSKEIHKTALGAENSVEWEYSQNTVEELVKLKEGGYKIIAIEQVSGSVSLEKFIPVKEDKYVLVFGNEVDGVSQEAVDHCDIAIEIPQAGTKHSLNVSISGGAVLWQFFCFYHKLL